MVGFHGAEGGVFIYLISLSLGISGILLRNSTSLVDAALGLFQGGAIVLIVIGLMLSATRMHKKMMKQQVAEFNREASEQSLDDILSEKKRVG